MENIGMLDLGTNTFQQGWVCPKCGRVYNPSTLLCFYCGNLVSKNSTNTTKE